MTQVRRGMLLMVPVLMGVALWGLGHDPQQANASQVSLDIQSERPIIVEIENILPPSAAGPSIPGPPPNVGPTTVNGLQQNPPHNVLNVPQDNCVHANLLGINGEVLGQYNRCLVEVPSDLIVNVDGITPATAIAQGPNLQTTTLTAAVPQPQEATSPLSLEAVGSLLSGLLLSHQD